MRIRSRKIYTYKNIDGDTMWILSTFRTNTTNEFYSRILFPVTGYSVSMPLNIVKSGNVKDRLKPSVLGIGYHGSKYEYIKKLDIEIFDKLYSIWKFMIYRCYKETNKSHKSYYDKSVTVHTKWHDFSAFFYDAIILPGYDRTKLLSGELSLDKDSLQTDSDKKIYSPDTCMWLTRKEQQKYVDHYTPQKKSKYLITHPDGHTTIEVGLKRISEKYNIDMKCISRVAKGFQKSTKNYKFERIE